MGVIQTVFRTITCNNSECTRTITYDASKEKETFEASGNEWMKSLRNVQAIDQRVFTYCSDVCEAKGIATGQHNLPEQKRIIEGTASAAQVAQAAAAAKAAEDAGKALKAGQPVQGLTL